MNKRRTRQTSFEIDLERISIDRSGKGKLAPRVCVPRKYLPRKLGVVSVASTVVALTLTSQCRPRPSSTVWRDDDVTRTAKDDAISGVMHRRRWRRRRRYRCAGGGGGGRRGLSDGRTFLLHVASVSLLSASPAFAYGSVFPVHSASPAVWHTDTLLFRDAKCFDQLWRGETWHNIPTIDCPNTSSGKEVSLLLFAVTFFKTNLPGFFFLLLK